MKRYTAFLPAAMLAISFACSNEGDVGSACESTKDCNTDLSCDVHDGKGTCQEADHHHAETRDAGRTEHDEHHSHSGDEDAGPDKDAGPADEHSHTADPHAADGGVAPDGRVSADASANEHIHGALDVSHWTKLPAVQLNATKDPTGGWTLQLSVANFDLAPDHASTASKEGEGHMHLYVDGEKLTRVYGPWFHLADLKPGKHQLRIELSANDHSALANGHQLIDDTVTIDQPKMSEPTHAHQGLTEVSAESAPAAQLTVHADPKSGFNLQVTLEKFALTPENVGAAPVLGEGHLHLYVDGKKLGRIYTDWYFLNALPKGEHEVAVELSSNDHQPYAVGGEKIRAAANVDVK